MWQKLKNIYHLIKAIAAVYYFGHPARSMTVIGVTGTDGKTTTSSLLYHLLREQGYKTALISTVSAVINGKVYDTGFHVSTPDAIHIQSYIKKAKEEGVTHLILEVTSHALDQNRVYGVPFRVGVLTNISREHLDYHKTMKNYIAAKTKLLQMSQTAVINRDDSSYTPVRKLLQNHPEVITYGLADTATVNPKNHPFSSKLFGEFNQYNTLAALAVADVLGLDKKQAAKAVETFILPEGRCEVMYEGEFLVLIDFAHTPNGIEKLLQSVKKEWTKGNIIHVFGSAGERDQGKRVEMGASSAKFADVIILTAEDPRSEKIERINASIKLGIPKEKEVLEIPDRSEAIARAVALAGPHDVVVITGKGHEKSMNLGNGEEPWNEHEAVKEALQKKGITV